MAGHNNLHKGPAMIKYADLNTNRYKFFRWTSRTAKLSFIYVIVVPLAVGIVAYRTDGKYQMRGKMRGDIISEF